VSPEEQHMLMKCANPDCSVCFNEAGRLFRFRLYADPRKAPVNAHSVQHFWLCKGCSELYTLECHKDNRVVIRPRLLASQAKRLMRVITADRL
jgi:hypothetical protein